MSPSFVFLACFIACFVAAALLEFTVFYCKVWILLFVVCFFVVADS